MSDSAVSVENLGKCYQLGERERYYALRDSLTSLVKYPYNLITNNGNTNKKSEIEHIWALRDINFEVKQGEIIGIIGRNGAGKSTLLKILSRITTPTEGRVKINGRVGSLLEVGTGFHPELTGRENIYLNGSILGMSKDEIERKYDEIVDFAEIEKFLDTPVKRYSSGMYVRLAFAVAAHLEPEILIIDEVLSVGDAEFQKKCIGKMNEVANTGRTVLYVSHNMASIKSLCTKSIFIDKGNIKKIDDVDSVINHYMSFLSTNKLSYQFDKKSDKIFISSINLVKNQINYGEVLSLIIEVKSKLKLSASIEVEIKDQNNYAIIYASTSPLMGKLVDLNQDKVNKMKVDLGPLNLASGDYFLYFWITMPWTEVYCKTDEPIRFSVNYSDPYNSGFDFKQSYSRGSHTTNINIEKEIS